MRVVRQQVVRQVFHGVFGSLLAHGLHALHDHGHDRGFLKDKKRVRCAR